MKAKQFFALHPVFTVAEFADTRAWADARKQAEPESTVQTLLRRHVLAGDLIRVRRGLYAVIPEGATPESVPVDRFLVASKLSSDAVVALHAALEFHGLATSMAAPVHFRSRERLARTTMCGCEYVPIHTPGAFFEDLDERRVKFCFYRGSEVRVTTRERTLAEAFEAPERSGGWEELAQSLWRCGGLEWEAVIEHATELGTAIGAARLGLFLEAWRSHLGIEERHLAALRALAPRQPRYVDAAKSPGKLVPGWSLVVSDEVMRLIARPPKE